MTRMFQFGFWVLLSAVLVTPVLEYFDRWDAPGLGSDTEFALFAIILILCLLLAVCKLLSDRGHDNEVELVPVRYSERPTTTRMNTRRLLFAVPPSISPPLRI